jgi:ribosomal protein S12 methylthiotransferase
LVSRPAADIMREADRLVKAGVKELLVISQDTSAYGVDVKYAESEWQGEAISARFVNLAEALSRFGVWVRLHYVYPYPHVDNVIPLMAAGKVLPYLDIPFQHAHPDVLKRMKRPAAHDRVLERIKSWREICPDLTIRSTFIVGFPGETEEEFQFLLDWLKEAQLDRVGCFKYEAVEGAAANEVGAPVPEEVKEERWHRFMQLQQEISAARLQLKVGKIIEVIIDELGDDEITARSKGDAPEIDGNVFVTPYEGAKVGDIITVVVDEASEYDLFATKVE